MFVCKGRCGCSRQQVFERSEVTCVMKLENAMDHLRSRCHRRRRMRMARRQGTATIGTRRTTATNIFISQVHAFHDFSRNGLVQLSTLVALDKTSLPRCPKLGLKITIWICITEIARRRCCLCYVFFIYILVVFSVPAYVIEG